MSHLLRKAVLLGDTLRIVLGMLLISMAGKVAPRRWNAGRRIYLAVGIYGNSSRDISDLTQAWDHPEQPLPPDPLKE
jgi:hypothetical protein